jgi:hypothetical protein
MRWRNFPNVTELLNSLSCSQELAVGLCHEPVESSSQHYTLFCLIYLSSSHLRLGKSVPNHLLSSAFFTKIVWTIHTSCLLHVPSTKQNTRSSASMDPIKLSSHADVQLLHSSSRANRRLSLCRYQGVWLQPPAHAGSSLADILYPENGGDTFLRNVS